MAAIIVDHTLGAMLDQHFSHSHGQFWNFVRSLGRAGNRVRMPDRIRLDHKPVRIPSLPDVALDLSARSTFLDGPGKYVGDLGASDFDRSDSWEASYSRNSNDFQRYRMDMAKTAVHRRCDFAMMAMYLTRYQACLIYLPSRFEPPRPFH